jgi:hypothetical protein
MSSKPPHCKTGTEKWGMVKEKGRKTKDKGKIEVKGHIKFKI